METKMKRAKSFAVKVAMIFIVVLAIAVLAAACTKETVETKKNRTSNTGTLDIGDKFTFGEYEQDNKTETKEKIEWLVIDRESDRALVISVYGLDAIPYNEKGGETTWETSSAREWLNGTFLSEAFTEKEAKAIISASVEPDKNPEYNVSSGNAVNDKIFLLSINQVNDYFETADAKCKPTAYAVDQGVYTTGTNTVVCWWNLRTPGNNSGNVAYVDANGFVSNDGTYVQVANNAIRPAFWIDISGYKSALKAETATESK